MEIARGIVRTRMGDRDVTCKFKSAPINNVEGSRGQRTLLYERWASGKSYIVLDRSRTKMRFFSGCLILSIFKMSV